MEPVHNRLQRHSEAMDYPKFVKAVSLAWVKAHPSIPLFALGSQKFDTKYPAITVHIHSRTPDNNTPKVIPLESYYTQEKYFDQNGDEQEREVAVTTLRQDFTNELVFTIHVPAQEGGGEVADILTEEFERFMVEHTGLFMKLGARNLRYLRRFHDDNLLKELSQQSVRRFVAYSLYTQNVTYVKHPQLQSLEIEIRASLDSMETIVTVLPSPND